MDEFFSVCMRRKLKVDAGKSKVMVFKRREVEVVDFNKTYRVSALLIGCEGVLRGENFENERMSVFRKNAMPTWRDGRRNKRGL